MADFAQGAIKFAGAGFRAESHEGSTEQALHFGIGFLAQRLSNFANGRTEQITAWPSKQISQLRQSDRGSAAGLSIFRIQTTEVILQDRCGSFLIAALQQ